MSNRFLVPVLTIWAIGLVGVSDLCHAGLTIDLPEIAGTYELGEMSGQVTFPGVEGLPEAFLEVRGTLTSGTYGLCNYPGEVFSRESSVHLYIYLDGTLCSIGSAYTGTTSGPFVAEGIFVSTEDFPLPLLALSGNFEYEAYIGWHPLEPGVTLCYIPMVSPVIEIDLVQIVSPNAVFANESSWGGVKALYR